MKNETDSLVCIIGLGPSGLAAALNLDLNGISDQVICIEAGDVIDNRVCSFITQGVCEKTEICSTISGVGGASLFAGNKFSMFPAGSSLIRIIGDEERTSNALSRSLELLSEYVPLSHRNTTQDVIQSGKKYYKRKGFEFKYYDSFVASTKDLRLGYKKMVDRLTQRGVKLLTNWKVLNIQQCHDKFKLVIENNGNTSTITCSFLIIAVGRSGESVLKHINERFVLKATENDNLEVGVRLEFPSFIFPDIDKYQVDLKLLFNKLRTFCVCKKGQLISYRQQGINILDGIYDPGNQSEFTNLGIMARINDPNINLAILNTIRRNMDQISNGFPLRQTFTDYMENNTLKYEAVIPATTKAITIWGNVYEIYPDIISDLLKQGVIKIVSELINKNYWHLINVLGPAIEYMQIKFPINKNFEIKHNMFLVGDGYGRYRGLLQAFCSGMIAADEVIDRVN